MGRDGRAVWAKRVERWSESGLTAKEFAAETGLNPHTLTHWKWKLGQLPVRRASRRRGEVAHFVEVTAPLPRTVIAVAAETAPAVVTTETPPAPVLEPLEVVLPDGLRVRVPAGFDVGALQRVVVALEAR